MSTARFLELAVRAGADNVSLHPFAGSETIASVAAQARSGGVRIAGVNALVDWALPDDPYPQPAFEALLELAVAVDAPLIVCVAPLRRNGFPPLPDILRSAAERLSLLAHIARPCGVSLAFEQVGRSSTRPDAQSGVRSLAGALAIAEQAGEDIRLVLDAFNIASAGEGFGQIRRLAPARVGIAHISDADAQLVTRVSPGAGVLDLAGFVGALRVCGYAGSLSLELFPSQPWDNPHAQASRAVRAMQDLLHLPARAVRRSKPRSAGSQQLFNENPH